MTRKVRDTGSPAATTSVTGTVPVKPAASTPTASGVPRVTEPESALSTGSSRRRRPSCSITNSGAPGVAIEPASIRLAITRPAAGAWTSAKASQVRASSTALAACATALSAWATAAAGLGDRALGLGNRALRHPLLRGDLLVFLSRDRAPLQQRLEPLVGRRRQLPLRLGLLQPRLGLPTAGRRLLQPGFRLAQAGLRLQDLCPQLPVIESGKQLAFLHHVALRGKHGERLPHDPG